VAPIVQTFKVKYCSQLQPFESTVAPGLYSNGNSLHLFADWRKDFRMHPRALLNLLSGILFHSSFIKEHTLQYFKKELKQ